jgi:hypothetical protein
MKAMAAAIIGSCLVAVLAGAQESYFNARVAQAKNKQAAVETETGVSWTNLLSKAEVDKAFSKSQQPILYAIIAACELQLESTGVKKDKGSNTTTNRIDKYKEDPK